MRLWIALIEGISYRGRIIPLNGTFRAPADAVEHLLVKGRVKAWSAPRPAARRKAPMPAAETD